MNSSNESDVSASPVRTLFAVAVLAILGFIAYSVWNPTTQELPGVVSKVEEENEQLRDQLNKLIAKQAELDAEKLMELENQQVQRSKLLELDALGKSAEAKLAKFSEEVSAWVSTQSALASDDRGRRLAANEAALTQYYALLDADLPEAHFVEASVSKLEGLLLPIREALETENPFYQPSESTVSLISEIADQAELGMESYKAANRRLAGILDLVSSSETLADEPLSEAIARLERKWAAEQNDRILAEMERVREEETAKLARLKVEKQRELAEASRRAEEERAASELARITAERAAAKEAEDRRVADIKAKAAREQLEVDFKRDLPELKRYLAPLFESAYSQPSSRAAQDMTNEKQPVSLTKLAASGALQESINGLSSLHYVIVGMRDRSKGVFRTGYIGGAYNRESDISTSRKAQAFLLKYGELLVEKGMLSP